MRYPRRGPDMKKRIVCRLVVQNDLVDTEDLAEFDDPISVVIYAGKFVNQQLATGIKAVGIQCPIGRGSVLMTCEPQCPRCSRHFVDSWSCSKVFARVSDNRLAAAPVFLAVLNLRTSLGV